MKENNPLKEEWNKKLEAEGLPEELPPLENTTLIPDNIFRKYIKDYLLSFRELPPNLQEDILEDFERSRYNKLSEKEILDRTEDLIKRAWELKAMPNQPSDLNYQKPIPVETVKLQKELQSEETQAEILSQLLEKGYGGALIDALIKNMEETLKSKPAPESIN